MDKYIKKMSLSLSLTHTHTHTKEYHSTLKKKEILSFEITRINLEGIMLNEIR